MADEIKIELKLDSKEAEKDAKKSGAVIGDNIVGGIDVKKAAIGGAIAAALGGVAVVMAAKKLGAVISEVTGAAIIQADAVAKLNNALITTGQFSKEASADLQKFAAQMERTTVFGDEAVISQLAFAQSMGATAEQSKTILAAAADMSTALDVDLNSAVRNITKTLGGYAGELGEVFPQLKALTQEQLRNGEGVKLLASAYKGFAEAQATTFSGALAKLTNAFGSVQEKMGESIATSDGFISIMNTLAEILQVVATQIDFSFLANSLISVTKIGAGLLDKVTKLGLAFATFTGNEAMISFMGSITAGTTKFKEELDKLTPAKMKDLEVEREALEIQRSKAAQLSKTAEVAEKTSTQISTAMAQVAASIKGALVKTASMGIQSLTKSLLLGENGFRNFGKAVASMMGDLAIQMGELFIGTALGMMALSGLGPAAALAAGLGLVALGTLMKSFSGGEGGGAATVPSTGGATIADASSTLTTDDGTSGLNEASSRERQQSVQLVVHGDVLDSEETGTRLVQILNDNFESSGGRLLTA